MIVINTKDQSVMLNKSNQIMLPWFTVIIPQKDRAEYIVHTLKTCMIQDYPNFEVIVSDDCSEDNSVEVIQELAKKDSRIKLFAHKEHLGMHDNFEFALNQVKPGFVMALGGDDGLTPGCIWRMYEIIKETGRELLTWTPAGFTYPEVDGGDSIFYVKRKKNTGIKILKSKDYLNKISKTFFYPSDECPMFYVKGVASTELVNRVKSRTPDHCFYYCPTPDGFSGVVLAGEVEDYAFTYEPLSIIGNTRKSQGKNYHRTDEKSKAEAQQFFNDSIRRSMHSELASQPYSPIVTLMTADYLLTARDLPGWPGQFDMFSFEALLNKSFSFISTSLFEQEVLVRELKILRAIAEQHNLMEMFESLYKKTKLKKKVGGHVNGFVLTHSIRFSGSSMNVNNIYDACLAVNFVYSFYNRVSPKAFVNFVKRMLSLVFGTKKIREEPLPNIN